MATISVMRRASLWLPPLIYMAAIYHFSSESHPLPALTEHVWDKLLHTIEYSGLALLLFRAIEGEGVRGWRAALLTALLVSAYGASDEWHQLFVPLRDADVSDWMTDTLAGMIGAMSCVFFDRVRQERKVRKGRKAGYSLRT